MKEEILYRIVGVGSEVKKDMPDKFRSVLDNETYGTTYAEYDFKKQRYLFTFINDNFDIYDMLGEKDKEIRRLNNIINKLEKALKDHQDIKVKCHYKEYWVEVSEVLDKLQELKEGNL